MDNKDVLKNVVGLSMSAVEVGVSSAEILSGTREVQSAATTMASAVEELSASIAGIENSARQTSGAVQESSELTAEGTREMADLQKEIRQTSAVFETVSGRTQDLQEVVSHLGRVVDLISKIAGQTNLLALNATIEAARAGAHGKGFAVVAGEVKSLSRQTREATETIRTQINQLNEVFGDVIDSVSTAHGNVNNIMEKAEKVSHDFSHISENAGSINDQVGALAQIISEQKMAIQMMAENMAVVKNKGDINMTAVSRLADQADASVALIEGWRAQLANENIEDKVIYLAQADHLLWKKKLLDMAVGRVQAKSADLSDHTLCRLGKWYYGPVEAHIKNNPAFAAIEDPHKRVHHHGIEAAKCFETGRFDQGMAHYADLEKASVEVIENLQALTQK